MTDFTRENLAGSQFEDVYLTGARFHDVDLTNAHFRLVDMTGVVIRGAVLVNMDISGMMQNLRVNGVEVVPLVEAELDRRHPGCLRTLLNEEWEHRLYAERDFDMLEAGPS